MRSDSAEDFVDEEELGGQDSSGMQDLAFDAIQIPNTFQGHIGGFSGGQVEA
jgi:hypothetical protein